MKIDYTKLNDRIVEQAVEVSKLALSEELKTRLFKNKIDRAIEMLEARKLSPTFYKSSY